MFSTFTIRETGLGSGAHVIDATLPKRELVIRSEDLRRLEDLPSGGCVVQWVELDQLFHQTVEGTARENLERLRREELEAVAEAQKLQQRHTDGLPILPIPRGRKS